MEEYPPSVILLILQILLFSQILSQKFEELKKVLQSSIKSFLGEKKVEVNKTLDEEKCEEGLKCLTSPFVVWKIS